MRNETLQLGMNYSAAQHRLKKMLMFSFIQAAELDNCFRCGKKLLADDFSIDHEEMHQKELLGVGSIKATFQSRSFVRIRNKQMVFTFIVASVEAN